MVQTTVSCPHCNFKAIQLVQICYLTEKTHGCGVFLAVKEKILEKHYLISLLKKEAFEHEQQQSLLHMNWNSHA